MPITEDEAEKFRRFTREVSQRAGLFAYDPDMTVWHYTDSAGLLGILESSSIRATQVAAVNDSTETVYATRLYREAVIAVKNRLTDDSDAQTFLQSVLDETKEGSDTPGHADSKYYVACFTSLEDDTGQWLKYGLTNGAGYALGFRARGLQMTGDMAVVRVNYDETLHRKIANDAAEATLRFYREGLVGDRLSDPDRWAKEFFEAWDQAIYRLAPVVKNSCFSSENEFRLVFELQSYGLPFVRFQQKQSLLGRYIDLKPYGWLGTRTPRLPLNKIIVGPGPHKGITTKAVEALLLQMGYTGVPVEMSKSPLQRP